MKYKIVKGTETFNKLLRLKEEIKRVNKEASDVVKKLGAEKYCKKNGKLVGGIGGIQFDSKPEGYKVIGKEWQNFYYPKVSNKKDLKLIENLPTIDYDALNSIIGFNGPQTIETNNGIFWINTVGLIWGDDYVLIDIDDECEFEPNKDTVEILGSEYITLKSKIKK